MLELSCASRCMHLWICVTSIEEPDAIVVSNIELLDARKEMRHSVFLVYSLKLEVSYKAVDRGLDPCLSTVSIFYCSGLYANFIRRVYTIGVPSGHVLNDVSHSSLVVFPCRSCSADYSVEFERKVRLVV